ncbi:chitin synthase regulatory factor chr2 [Gigaspora margarita]|nr:chitin synthase regulatory factor chr2 [Gigaspora margarita]
MTLLADESSTNDIFLMIQCSKVELIIKKETIKPSAELINKVKEALKHYDPYHKLMDVFNSYGYFLPKKMILGHKIYRVTCLNVDQYLTEPNNKDNEIKWTIFDDFSENKLEVILSQWEKYMSSYNFDLSYLVSIDGELIMKNKIKEWIKFCLESDLDSLQVIGCKELYPLYEIFDLTLRQEIESVLGINIQIDSTFEIDNQAKFINRNNIKERVLMAGIVPIKGPPFSYSVKFPICFKSNNYQVFGKFITRDDEPIDEVIIKFEFMDTYGFLIFMEDYNFTYKNPKIAWILIGIPAEVGYFSTNTRKINVLGSGNEPFALKSNNNNILLNVPEYLPQDSVIVVSFKHPPSNDEPKFIAKILNYQDNKILFNVYCHDYESSDSEESNEDSKTLDRENDNEDSKFFDNEDINEDSKGNFFFGEYDEDSDSNDTRIDDFEHDKSNYVKKSLIKASKCSIQWFILRNSDIADLIYLNKIGQGFYLIKSKKPSYPISPTSISNWVNKEESKPSLNKKQYLSFYRRPTSSIKHAISSLAFASGAVAAATAFGFVFSLPTKPKHSLQLSERSPSKQFKLFLSKNKNPSPTKNVLHQSTIHPLMVHLDNIDDDISSTYSDVSSVYTVDRKISSIPDIPGILAQAFDSSSAVCSFNSRSIETLQEEEEEDWDTNTDNFINPPKARSSLPPSMPVSPKYLTPPKLYNRSNSLPPSVIPKSFYQQPTPSESWDDDFDLDNDEINVPNSVEQAQFSLRMEITTIRDFDSQIKELKKLRNKKQLLATTVQSKITRKLPNGFAKFKKKSKLYKDLETLFNQDWEEAAIIIDLFDKSEDKQQTFGGGKMVIIGIKEIPSERHIQALKKIIVEELGENAQDVIFMDDNDKKKDKRSINNDDSRQKEYFRISVEVLPSLIDHLKKLQDRLSEHIDKLDVLASNERGS